jgi:hypothetical protein
MPKFDRYTLFARLFPAIIAIAPALALVAVLISWKTINLSHGIAIIALGVLFMVFSDVARKRGRAVEPKIIEKMGGLPSTTMQRHRDDTLDAPTKARIHTFLADKLDEKAPSAKAEEKAPDLADGFYARGATWLRENTRNEKDFAILLSENITYGFRRNVYGLRIPALILNGAIVVLCIGAYFTALSQKYEVDLRPVFVIAFLHAGYLAFFSTQAAVMEAARIYARQLLMSVNSPKLQKAPRAEKKAS